MQKTNKAFRKRFKVSATGKVLQNLAGRRHLAGSKKSKKKRASRRRGTTDPTDTHRVLQSLPFQR